MDEMNDLTVFITGATSGFGEATAKILHQAGAKVILTGRRLERLQKLKKELNDDRVHYLELDVRNKEMVENAIKNLPKDFANINVLINNAGLALGLEPAPLCNIDDWETMVDTNIKGVLYCTHYILPIMMENNDGYIINIGSIAGNYPYPGANVYGATKAFLRQFSLNLRADLLGNNIRITNIEPGNAETEFSLIRFKGDDKRASDVYKDMKAITADDIAETIYWCLSRPKHFNVNTIEVMPTSQAFSPFNIKRSLSK
jgi:NADP-dependent 3-hydroxy acid dehydrogenase YdfG